MATLCVAIVYESLVWSLEIIVTRGSGESSIVCKAQGGHHLYSCYRSYRRNCGYEITWLNARNLLFYNCSLDRSIMIVSGLWSRSAHEGRVEWNLSQFVGLPLCWCVQICFCISQVIFEARWNAGDAAELKCLRDFSLDVSPSHENLLDSGS